MAKGKGGGAPINRPKGGVKITSGGAHTVRIGKDKRVGGRGR